MSFSFNHIHDLILYATNRMIWNNRFFCFISILILKTRQAIILLRKTVRLHTFCAKSVTLTHQYWKRYWCHCSTFWHLILRGLQCTNTSLFLTAVVQKIRPVFAIFLLQSSVHTEKHLPQTECHDAATHVAYWNRVTQLTLLATLVTP